jgi:hypothetical protein
MATIIAQVGHFYSGEVGQYYSGADNQASGQLAQCLRVEPIKVWWAGDHGA